MAFQFGIQSAQLKSFNIKIKGKWLNPAGIKNFSFSYGIDELQMGGALSYYDASNISEIIQYGDKIEVSFMNWDNELYNHSFIITGGNYTRDAQGYYVLSLTFEDPTSNALKKLYPTKGFTSPKNMVEIITDVDTAKGIFSAKQKDFKTPSTKFENFVCPKNKSFYSVVQYLKTKSDYLLFQTQKKFRLQKLKDLVSKGPKMTLYYRANNEMSKQSIYDFRLDYNKTGDNVIYTPNLQINYFNPTKKEFQKEITSFKKTTGEFPFETVAPKFSTEQKEILASDNFNKNHYHHIYSLKTAENFALEVLTFPKFSIEVGDIVKVDLTSTIDKSSPESNVAGKFLVANITYSLINTSIIKKMKLIRAKSKPLHHQ